MNVGHGKNVSVGLEHSVIARERSARSNLID